MRVRSVLARGLGTLAFVAILVPGVSPSAQGPTFDVVSIRPSPPSAPGASTTQRMEQRPDGGFTMINHTVAALIAQAYPPHVPVEIEGLPEWARQDRFDITATAAAPAPTREVRLAMLRNMLADRFGLVVHVEQREHDVFDLVLARSDGRLGPGLQRLPDVDCDAVQAARDAEREAALAAGQPPPPAFRMGPTGPMPPCAVRLAFTLFEAQTTMPGLALAFSRMATSPRQVVDKTGLAGSYSVRLEFDPVATRRGPEVTASTDGPPTLFTAVQEQLGLRLVPSRALRETLVVDRIHRPTEN